MSDQVDAILDRVVGRPESFSGWFAQLLIDRRERRAAELRAVTS